MSVKTRFGRCWRPLQPTCSRLDVRRPVTQFWGAVMPELPDLLASRDAMRAELADFDSNGDNNCNTGLT